MSVDTVSTDVTPAALSETPRRLSSRQERKLLEFVEEQFLEITRDYKKRCRHLSIPTECVVLSKQ